jgi:PAS domain S-box-containing protein
MFGYEPDRVVGDSKKEIIHADDVDEVNRRLGQLTTGEIERAQVTYRARHRDGHWVWTEGSFSLARDESTGQPTMIVCTLRDVSERKQQSDERDGATALLERLTMERAERASGAKARFLAAISHELRTPLNAILGYAQLLRLDGGLNVTQSARVDSMLDAGKHLLAMVNHVLDLSEIEGEHVTLQAIETELDELVAGCLDSLRPAAQQKGLTLGFVAAPGAPRRVITDPIRLRQLLLNLVGNAVNFTAKGRVELRLAPADMAAVRIEVTDNGPGIPEDIRSRLFHDFERLGFDAHSVERAGLGLALSARLAKLMKARIGHQNIPGGGSMFWIELPLPPESADCITLEAPETRSAQTIVWRVLVVDDVAMNRDIAGSLLRAAGHEVTYAEGGAEAVAAASASDFDVVGMDIQMPGMDGLEATRRIRALPGARGRVPIVALTAQAFAEQVEECRKAGMLGHLAKPFTQAALLATLESAIAAGRQSSDEAIAPIMIGSESPIFDLEAFERTTAFLTPSAVDKHLRTLVGDAANLLQSLQKLDGASQAARKVAAAAHSLAGSAGLFGFDRLALLARRFEYAIQTESPEFLSLKDALAAAIEATLPAMRSQSKVGVAPAPESVPSAACSA